MLISIQKHRDPINKALKKQQKLDLILTKNEFMLIEELVKVLDPVLHVVSIIQRRETNVLQADSAVQLLYEEFNSYNDGSIAKEFYDNLVRRIDDRTPEEVLAAVRFLDSKKYILSHQTNFF